MSEAPSIRLAGSADIAVVQAIVKTAYTPWITRIGREPGPLLEDYRALIAAGRVHVAGRAGLVEGILVLLPGPEAMLLDNVAVAPAAQGLGLGRLLVAFAERVALDAGLTCIRLYTNAAMTENVALYTRFGYHETHRVTEHGLHRVYMAKTLPSVGRTPGSEEV